jgi:hypothetical protein
VIAIVIIAALAVVLLVYVLGPLRTSGDTEPSYAALRRAELTGRKRAALEAILDMEGERSVGKLSAEDYDVLRREYELEAITALRELDRVSGADSAAPSDDRLEAEIAALRDELRCPNCGAPRARGRACKRCGAR